MKNIFLIVLLLIISSCNTPPQKVEKEIVTSDKLLEDLYTKNIDDIDTVWRHPDFDSAVALILNGNSGLLHNLKRMDTVYGKTSRRRLGQAQLASITASLSGKRKETFAPADCFVPYHGIYFYKKGEITGRIAICFVCSNYFTLPQENGGINCDETKQIFLDLGLPAYNWDDTAETAQAKVKYRDFFPKRKK